MNIMKKMFFLALSFLLISSGLMAQEDIKKDLGTAKKALAAFTLDQANNKPKLTEAKEAIDRVMNTDAGKASGAAWQMKGEIYNEIASQIIQVRQLNFGTMDALPKADNPAADAFVAFKKAMEMAVKSFEKKDALKGVQLAQSNLSNMGIFQYEDQEYAKAYECFKDVIEAHDILKANAEKSSLDVEADYQNQMYISGLAALNASMKPEAKMFFEKLYGMKYDKPVVYEAMYQLKADEDINEAYKFLEEGRKRYPEDVSILFALINHNLKTGKLDELLTELKEAIAKEPDNVSLYSVLGNVYDQLYQKSDEAGDKAKAEEYFNEALNYYTKATEKDPKYVDAIYSIGALYYNRAALLTKQMNALSDDYSKEGLKKYEDLKTRIFAEFDKALPYFQRAEAIDANDVNTLIALKEIFARQNKLDISNEFKTRLETVQNGGKNETPYFKN
jgi:tetratricopeptide (TPR) repeat protein